MRAWRLLLLNVGLFVFANVIGCSSKDPGLVNVFPDGYLAIDGSNTQSDTTTTTNPEGPTIQIVSPKKDEQVTTSIVTIKAKITDPDIVDEKSVTVSIGDQTPQQMVLQVDGSYEADVDVSDLEGAVQFAVRAKDLLGDSNVMVSSFVRISGPTVVIVSPTENSRHTGSLTIQVIVTDKVETKTFEAKIGSHVLTLQAKPLDGKTKTSHEGTVVFSDYSPPLSGEQLLHVTVVNKDGAKTEVKRVFFIDNEGPLISVQEPVAGTLIGGLITISATISDEAGVLAESVKAVVGNELESRTVVLVAAPGSTTYSAQFDTRTLSSSFLWPVVSFRASDKLGNESHIDIEVGLDNGQPVVELDPPAQFFEGRRRTIEGEEVVQCSWPFDPVGEDAANDLSVVPQITEFRVRIEDQGNTIASAEWVPISGLDNSTIKMYVLDDSSTAIVLDTDGDGFCDSINPSVIPLGTKPLAGQAVALDLAPITPGGSPNYTEWTGEFPFSVCTLGDEAAAPKTMCPNTWLSRVIPGNGGGTGAAIYSIPPIAGNYPPFDCVGLPFDFKANKIEDGWACAAAVAKDELGNKGVSPPLRLWVDKASTTFLPSSLPLPEGAGAPPTCRGTMKTDGTILVGVDENDPNTCKFRTSAELFPQRYPPQELLLLP